VLMCKLSKPEIMKSRRAEVVGRVDITEMEVYTWVCTMCQWVENESEHGGT
jgi:hypothetical protein